MRIQGYSFALLFSFFALALPQIQIGQETKPKSGELKSAKGIPPEKVTPKKVLPADDASKATEDKDSFKIEPGSRTQADAIWKKKTPGMAFKVMRQHGTETKFSGKYTRSKTKGIYRCAGCGAVLFSSEQKFESGTGWPSFWAPLAPDNIGESVDTTLASETRTEVHCIACNGHLGHVFSDGPKPTGLRYCLNSVALKLDDSEAAKKLMKDGPKKEDSKGQSESKQQ
jgi:peptide-methionine (R)-S-oxide reductase